MPLTVPKGDSCFPPQDVYDKVDYLSSLGKTQTAVVQRDADIGVAEAERDAGIRVRGLFFPPPGTGSSEVAGPWLLRGPTAAALPAPRKLSAKRRCWM